MKNKHKTSPKPEVELGQEVPTVIREQQVDT
jgi:hypothetical protein